MEALPNRDTVENIGQRIRQLRESRGMKYVVRNGKDFLVVEQVFCPNGHSLMVDNVRIHEVTLGCAPCVATDVPAPAASPMLAPTLKASGL